MIPHGYLKNVQCCAHWCYQMYLWNNDLNIEQPNWKTIKTLTYGVRSSGKLAVCGLRKTAKIMESKYKRAEEEIYKRIYVNDCISGETGAVC